MTSHESKAFAYLHCFASNRSHMVCEILHFTKTFVVTSHESKAFAYLHCFASNRLHMVCGILHFTNESKALTMSASVMVRYVRIAKENISSSIYHSSIPSQHSFVCNWSHSVDTWVEGRHACNARRSLIFMWCHNRSMGEMDKHNTTISILPAN